MGRLRTAPARLSQAPRRIDFAPKLANKFYQSAPWRSLVASIIKARGRRCERCGAAGGRVYGDHIIELKDGGETLAASNVMLLCASCHGAKTQQAKRDRIGLG